MQTMGREASDHIIRGGNVMKRAFIGVGLFLVLIVSSLFLCAQAFAQTPGMKFLEDVTVPDDTVMQPGEVFTKTWKLKNTGDVDWLGYSLRFVSGEKMDGVPEAVPPTKTGGIADVTVYFTAPQTDGTYSSWWSLVDQNGIRVGSQFYVRIVVGAGGSAKPEIVQTIEEFMATHGTVHGMNEWFTLDGIDFRVIDVWRNEAIWGPLCGPCTINGGVWAIVRFNVTNHTGYSAIIADHVKVYMLDSKLNEYTESYIPLRIPRKALVSAGALFGNEVGTVWAEMGTGYIDAAMIHVEPVPADTDILYAVFEDLKTGERVFVRLQHLASKSEMRYEGEFINAPARE